MTRPLLYKTVVELEAAVRRNQHHRAELELIRAELRHRNTPSAKALAATVRDHLAFLDQTGLRDLSREPPSTPPAPQADAGKYAAVHAAAEAQGSPVKLGWQHTNTIFIAGTSGMNRAETVYGTIHRICLEAGRAGVGAAELATELRRRQVGNPRSHFCNGLPPIGWAEGWIDTAVSGGVIRRRSGPPALGKPKPDNRSDHSRSTVLTGRAGPQRSRLDIIAGLIDTHWGDREPLLDLQKQLAQLTGRDVQKLSGRVCARLTALSENGAMPAAPATPPRIPSSPAAAPPPAPLPTSARKPAPMTETRRMTEEAVASLRTKLIDLSKKNPLISFKHGGRSASILRIVDERPDLLCTMLNKEPKGMGFEPLPGEDDTPRDEQTPAFKIAYERARLTDDAFLSATEMLGDDERDANAWQQAERDLRSGVRRQLGLPALDYGKTLDVTAIARAHGFDPSYDLKASDDDDVAAHHEDDRLRVLLTAKELDKRLKTIWERAQSHSRETGIDTLNLAIGFVDWSEDEAPETRLHAPILLMPVKLERAVTRGRYEYRLFCRDDPIKVNVALREKMRTAWGLDLPPLREEETAESYFIRVADVLARGRNLRLRRFVTLAVLPPTILWEDLDPAKWPEAAFGTHRLLPGLLGAAPVGGEVSLGETIDIDAPEWARSAPALIRPADASQHSALVDVREGHDLAIEGPPGTGKSETITNMIATALAAGKRVLFVAEKQAALKVVANRLRASGFGPLLLELHGEGARRADVYDGLRERLRTRVVRNPGLLDSQRLQLDQQRSLLRRYMALIDQSLGAVARSAYWLAWREISLRESFARAVVDAVADHWSPPEAKAINRAMLAERRSRLDTFGAALAAIVRDAGNGERTRWVAAERIDPFDQRPQLHAAGEAAAAAQAVAQATRALDELVVLGLPEPRADFDAVDAQFAALEPFEPVAEEVARAALRHPDTARALLRQQARWRQLGSKLAADVDVPAAIDDVAIAALTNAIEGARPVPDSVTAAADRLDAAVKAVRVAQSCHAERRLLVERLDLDPAITPAAMRDVLGAVAALGGERASVTMLYRPDLVGTLTGAAIAEERSRAAALREERGALAGQINDEAFETETAELNRTADTLADSGAFARLFGGEFKTARRRLSRWAPGKADRGAGAELLRRLARHLGQAASFRRDSPVAGWFPAVLWKGADSDWDALAQAREVLIDARRRLASQGADAALSRWLAMTETDRDRLAAASARVAPLLDMADQVGLGDQPISSLDDELASMKRTGEALQAALAAVRARPDGAIVRDGQDLASRLAVFQAAGEDFRKLAAQGGFAWVSDVGAPLEALARTLDHADELCAAAGPLPIVAALTAAETPIDLLESLISAGGKWRSAKANWAAASGRLAEAARLDAEKLAPAWQELATTLGAMAADETGVRLAADLQKYGRALDEVELGALGHAALEGAAPADRLADLYELLLCRRLLRTYLGGDGEELGRTGGLTLVRARENFTRIDIELHTLEAKAIIAQRLDDKAPEGVSHGRVGDFTDMGALNHELSLRKPRTPLRDVVHRAGAAMQALKPVWMMSPTSAAQYVRPGSLTFDLLVVDEASQMRPEYSISSVLRGGQFVVVGDANQLPPSDHFQTSSEVEAEDEAGIVENTESILDLANQRFRRRRRLKWHYRSQHESLIQFSNREFYDRDLVVFPSPMGNDDPLLGVKCHYVRGALYESSINEKEAEEVINEALRLMLTYPDRSIGIAAMNAKQTELIQNQFERVELEQPAIRRYLERWSDGVEEFFIKNLENVQGDERDIILISTVYGPGKDGRVLQNFGLMNREVGWRRLNVLVTRAKVSTRLFTSLRPDDVKVTPTSSRGVRTLQAYLTYAHNGASYQDASGGEPDSDFEVFVAEAIRESGYEVVHQVGVEGFRIDLGIRHRDYPLGFIAGIECDGASFHHGLTVRDRDRIRQSVLEGMGWKIYRIWSTDWFSDPTRELQRLLTFLSSQRAFYAEEYARASPPQQSPQLEKDQTRTEVDADPDHGLHSDPAPFTLSVPATAEPKSATPASAAVRQHEAGPTGQAMPPVNGIDWYAVIKGQLYEVWLEGQLAGDIEVRFRATAAPRLQGNQIMVSRSEYQGRVEATDERFFSDDIHAAVREIARRARAAPEPTT